MGPCAVFALGSVLIASAALGADVLFPQPIHLTRSVADPLANQEMTVEEYCAGNLVVTVRGSRVVIADYGRQTIVEIDREALTWSVTSFADIAQNRVSPSRPRDARVVPSRDEAVSLGTGRAAHGREVERFEITAAEGSTKKVAIDRGVHLTRGALDVLLGVAYPAEPGPDHPMLVAAAENRSRQKRPRPDAADVPESATFGLPVEQEISFGPGEKTLITRAQVLRVGHELPPPDLLLIPAGAKQVESRVTVGQRRLEELERLPGQER